MKSIIGLALGLGMSALVNAQSIPTLAKVYSGNTTETSINASKKNPKTQTQNVTATLTVIKQDGPHVEFTYQNPHYKAYEIGTISPDGKKLVFSSNRNNGGTRDTNLFIADWID